MPKKAVKKEEPPKTDKPERQPEQKDAGENETQPAVEKPAEVTPQQLAEAAFQAWLSKQRENPVDWWPIQPIDLSSNLPLLTPADDHIVFVTGDITKQDTYRLTARPAMKKVTAIRLEALPDPRLPGGGPGMTYYEGRKGDFFLTEFRPAADGKPLKLAAATDSYSKNAFGANPATAAMAIDGDPQTGWGAADRPGQRHVAVFNLAEPTDINELQLEMTFGRHFASSLGKFRLSLTTAPAPAAVHLEPDEEDLVARVADPPTEFELNRLRLAYFLQAKELEKPASAVWKEIAPPQPTTTLVFQERPPENPRPTHLHHRGEYLQPKGSVDAVVPAFLNPLADGAPRNRLTFARWLVSRDNPLTARVVVNQQWAALFGRGLGSTVQDFGFQGDPPTHPALLDWLAVEFMDSGRNMKHLHRLIVMSAAYRQSSLAPPAAREKDPANLLLSRGPRLRLEAEIIRDSALAASGLLSPKLGGPPVKPPQPNSVTEAAYGAFKWESSTGEDRHRRSLYTFMKRTAPFAMYTVFDGPSGEACLARRDVSNTPLQSLTLLNDEMFIEIAAALGRRVAMSTGGDREKATFLFRLVLIRPPTDSELADLTGFVDQQRTAFTATPKQARALSGMKEDKEDQDETAINVAAWIALSRAVLSLDEAVTRN